MALMWEQVRLLEQAVKAYGFPLDYFDFQSGQGQVAPHVSHLEAVIHAQLTSACPDEIAAGLGNIIYWGNSTAGYRNDRFGRFRSQIPAFAPHEDWRALLRAGMPSLLDIKRLKYPGYSGVSFISKVLMFLDPDHHCVLDLRISKLSRPGRARPRALDGLKSYPTLIPATRHNQTVYDAWRAECRQISACYFEGRYRAADIERGLFQLLDKEPVAAQAIYDGF